MMSKCCSLNAKDLLPAFLESCLIFKGFQGTLSIKNTIVSPNPAGTKQ